MESPPSLEAAPLSEDSGLIITSGSFSSDSGLAHIHSELQESDCDEKSLSQYDSQDVSEHICGDNFNTVKKGPLKFTLSTIEPPPQFQDNPNTNKQINETNGIVDQLLCSEKMSEVIPTSSTQKCVDSEKNFDEKINNFQSCKKRFTAPRLMHLSPCHSGMRPGSRTSLQNSRLSSSHNSLTTQTEADDSSFITQAISHDTLSAGSMDIADMYNVPFDSDIYTIPVDSVRPIHSSKFQRHRARNSFHNIGNVSYSNVINNIPLPPRIPISSKKVGNASVLDTKRHSIPGTSCHTKLPIKEEPLHMKFSDIKSYVGSLNFNFENSKCKINNTSTKNKGSVGLFNNQDSNTNSFREHLDSLTNESIESNNNLERSKKRIFSIKHCKKHQDGYIPREFSEEDKSNELKSDVGKIASRKSPIKSLSLNFKQTLCNLFKLKKVISIDYNDSESVNNNCDQLTSIQPSASLVQRALPSVPNTLTNQFHPQSENKEGKKVNNALCASEDNTLLDFPTSIQIVKDYGWYWGPISVEASEKLLSEEPDGSFILRDSSDDHYIFTISFKLNGGVRHVRIEHDQGKFCFGSCTMFKARNIVEFIENAVETSRSGRYLFFLNLRPALGPVRVLLLYPVSRFMRVQSLQHMCRFVILKFVRRDLIDELPLPRRLIDYLSTPQYYSESLSDT